MRLVTVLYLAYLVLPMALLAVGSLGDSWTNSLLPQGMTSRWYTDWAEDPTFSRAFLVSLKVVCATCLIDAVIGLPLAYAVHASAHRGVQAVARLATLLPIAVPELVLAFGFILAFSSDRLPWLGGFWLLVAAHVVLTLPYLVLTLLSDMGTLDLGILERAGESLGAGFGRRFVDIVLPSVRHALMSGLILVTAISIGEFQVSNLVSGFLNRTYPVVLLQAFYGATGLACAATVILLALAILAAAAGALTARVAGGAAHGAGGGRA
ncbi:MAG: ABC transporter permease subunit [Rhodospirillum sp.]|nr:ABC transporter permease subunit [Rhodospirillum sp.]MCF8489326.1 ABC transporter permease subunit [Rhodospirillum sp.]MCF8503228.1 ABC transporter permease subunit [Rhodospirillum sp.]